MLIADGGGGSRPHVAPPANPPKPQPTPANHNKPSTSGADRAREAQRQLEALLERIREMQRQAAEARRRAAEALQKAEQARIAAEAAREKADKSKTPVDERGAKKSEQDYATADARLKKETAEAHRHDKEVALANAQVAQKREASKRADGKASEDADKKVKSAQDELDAARRTSDLSNDALDYEEKATKALAAEHQVADLTPAAGRPWSTVPKADQDALAKARSDAETFRKDADAAKGKFTAAVGAQAPIAFYGPPPATADGQPAADAPADPMHSPLQQFLQVSPPLATSPSSGTTTFTPGIPLTPQVTPDVKKTLNGIADGKTVDQIAKERGMTAAEVVAEARSGGVTIESGAVDVTNDQSSVTVTRGDASLVYTRDGKNDSLTLKATFADPKSPDGTRTVEATRDKDGRFIQTVKDDKSGDTTTHVIDPDAGTRTDVVEKKDGTRTETTTDLTGATVTRPVKAGEDYLDVAKAAGLTPEQLLALNPGVDYGKPLSEGQEMVVSGVRTTTVTTNTDGTKLEKTVESDGSIHAVATTKDGRRITLMGDEAPDHSPAAQIRKGLFDEGKTVADVAKAMGMTEDQVLAALPEGTVDVTKPTSDNGDVETRTLYDPVSNKVVVETHDWQHDGTSHRVVDDGTNFKVRQLDPETGKYVTKDVAGGVGYLQKLADDARGDVADIDSRISALDATIRQYRRMGESTTELQEQRQQLVNQRDTARGEADIVQARATSGLIKNQQVQLDRIAANAYQRQFVARPGSDEQKDATKALDEILALTDKVDRLVKSGDMDVEFLIADLDRRQAHTAKTDADENLQEAFRKWKDEVWMWQGLDEKTAEKLKAEGQRSNHRIFASLDQENEVAWEAFEYQQESWEKYGTDGANDIELAARNAWLQRNQAGDAEVKANGRHDQVAIDKGMADSHVIQGDIDRLQAKKDTWAAANPKAFSGNFPAADGEHGGQQELDALNDQRTQLEVGVVRDTQALKYNQHLEGLSIDQREDPEKLKEADQDYAEKNAKDIEAADQRINDLQMAGLNQRAKASDDYIAQWARDNPKLQARLDDLSTAGITNIRMLENLQSRRDELLGSSHEFQQLDAALTLRADTEFRLARIGDEDVARVQKDLDGIDKTVEGQTWLRDMFSDKAEDSQHWTRDQRDEAKQLRDDLASGKISATEYTQRRDEMIDGYGMESIDVGRDLRDSNETWAIVDDSVRMAATAAAGIATTIATGGNIVAGIAVGVAVNQLWDTGNDIYAASNGRDIYADGHSSLFTLAGRGAATAFGHDDLTLDQTMFTLKDDAVDIASAAVSATGAGAGLRTSAALTAKVALKKGISLAEGQTLGWGSRAVVGAKAGFVAQGVDGVGRVGVETLDVGLDGQLGTDEGARRIGTTLVNGAIGLGTSWITGGVSAAIPLNTARITASNVLAQGANDLVGSYGTGQLISLANNGRLMTGNETIAASLQAVPGTILNIGLHPSWHESPSATPSKPAPVATGKKPPVGLGPDGKPLVPESVSGSWEKAASRAEALIRRHELASAPGSTTPGLRPTASETALLRWLQQDPPAGSGTVFVVSTLGPKDTVFGASGGVRARNGDTFATYAEAATAAAARGGAWVNRVQPDTQALPMTARRRVGADEIVGSMHVSKDGNALPLGIPNTRHGDLRVVPAGEPTVKGAVKAALSAQPANAKIDPIRMMNIAAGLRFTAEITKATTGMTFGTSFLGGRAASVAPGPLSGFGRWAYLASSQRGKEALAAATVGNVGKADKLIGKVIDGTGSRGDKVMDPGKAQTIRDNITKVGAAGSKVQDVLKAMGTDAPSSKHFRLHTLDAPADAVPALMADYLAVPGMRKFEQALRAEAGGEFHGKSRTETRETLLGRLDAMDAAELQRVRDDAADTSPQARLLRDFPAVCDRLVRTAGARADLRDAHQDLFDAVVGMVGKEGRIDLGKAEGLAGSTNSPDTQLGKFSRRAVILTNVNLAVGAGFKSRAVGDGGVVTEFANAADFFTLGTAGMNIIYNRKVEALSDTKARVTAEAEDAGMTYDAYVAGNSPEQVAARQSVEAADAEKTKWNRWRDFAGISSGVRAYGQGALLTQLDFSGLPHGNLIQGALVGGSFVQGTLTMGWVGLQTYMPLRNGNLPTFTKVAKWTTAGAIVLVPLSTQVLTAIFQPAGEKKDSYYAAAWKWLFPDHSTVEKHGALPWAIPDVHAGDPLDDTAFTRVEAATLPELEPVFATVDGSDARTRTLWGISGDRADELLADPAFFPARVAEGPGQQPHPALAQLFNLNPRFYPALNDGRVTEAPGDPDTLRDGWQVQVGAQWRMG